MMNNGISSVTVGLPVTDISQATDWYRQLLGERDEMSPMDGIWEICITPSFWLQLFESDSEESSLKSVNFETNNIGDTHKMVLGLGVDVGQIETVPDAIQYFEFSDPFGNLLSFYEILSSNT